MFYPTILALLATLVVVSRACDILNVVNNPYPAPDAVAPEGYAIKIETNLESSPEPIIIYVNRSWAPLGADRLYSLVQDGYYNQAAFFRVVPDFVVQFGIAAQPKETAKWNTNIKDDPVLTSNVAWTVTYATAGPDTRTSQLFINYIDNSRLDDMGFSPFGVVVSGFNTALAIYNPTPGDSNGIDQDAYTMKGNSWLLKNYPETTLITCATLMQNTSGLKIPDLPKSGTSGVLSILNSKSGSTAVIIISILFGGYCLYIVVAVVREALKSSSSASSRSKPNEIVVREEQRYEMVSLDQSQDRNDDGGND